VLRDFFGVECKDLFVLFEEVVDVIEMFFVEGLFVI